MEIGLLGPLIVSMEGKPVKLTAAKPRTLLALLALHSGCLVPTDAIVHELWGEEPCPTAESTVRTYIFQIRRLIGGLLGDSHGAPQDIIKTVPCGYLLSAPNADSEADRYWKAVAAGREALSSGDYARAGIRFESALGLWRGSALVDVRMGTRLQAAARRLEESRLLVLEYRLEAELQLGRHWEILGELSNLCSEHELHEGLHAKYMLALYRADRRSEALAVFQRLRTAMVETLGMEPSTRVRNLQQDILRSGGVSDAADLTDLLQAQSRTIAELTARIAEIEERIGVRAAIRPSRRLSREDGLSHAQ